MSADAPLRQPIPLARSILWNPATAGARGGRPGSIPFPIFVAQSAVAAIHEHLTTALPHPGQGLLGFLVGDMCECPDTNVAYLVIDAALRLSQPIYGDRTIDVVTRIWDRIEAQVAEAKGHLIGWYHTHAPAALDVGTRRRDARTLLRRAVASRSRIGDRPRWQPRSWLLPGRRGRGVAYNAAAVLRALERRIVSPGRQEALLRDVEELPGLQPARRSAAPNPAEAGTAASARGRGCVGAGTGAGSRTRARTAGEAR